jgi:hypothetical protein
LAHPDNSNVPARRYREMLLRIKKGKVFSEEIIMEFMRFIVG